RRAGDQHSFPVAMRRSEHDLRAQNAPLDHFHWTADDKRDPDRRCQMVDRVALAHEAIHDRLTHDRLVDELEAWRSVEVGDIGQSACGKIVYSGDTVALLDQSIAQVRCNESRSAGN